MVMDTPDHEAEANLVRPYTLTAGRTHTDVPLPLEAPVQTLRVAQPNQWPVSDPRGRIVELCQGAPSVAEIGRASCRERV